MLSKQSSYGDFHKDEIKSGEIWTPFGNTSIWNYFSSQVVTIMRFPPQVSVWKCNHLVSVWKHLHLELYQFSSGHHNEISSPSFRLEMQTFGLRLETSPFGTVQVPLSKWLPYGSLQCNLLIN